MPGCRQPFPRDKVTRSWAVLWEHVLPLQPGPARNVQAQPRKYLPKILTMVVAEKSYDRAEQLLLSYGGNPAIVQPFYS